MNFHENGLNHIHEEEHQSESCDSEDSNRPDQPNYDYPDFADDEDDYYSKNRYDSSDDSNSGCYNKKYSKKRHLQAYLNSSDEIDEDEDDDSDY